MTLDTPLALLQWEAEASLTDTLLGTCHEARFIGFSKFLTIALIEYNFLWSLYNIENVPPEVRGLLSPFEKAEKTRGE